MSANRRKRVCILGENVRKQLFGARTGAVGPGKPYAINGLPFRSSASPDKKQSSSYSGLTSTRSSSPIDHGARLSA